MHALRLIAFAAGVSAVAMPKPYPAATRAAAAVLVRQAVSTLAPYVPGPQNCTGTVQCLNLDGPYELYCKTVTELFVEFDALGTSCPPGQPGPTPTPTSCANDCEPSFQHESWPPA